MKGHHTEETKLKMRLAKLGKSTSRKGKTGIYSPETLEKMRKAKLGTKQSKETIELGSTSEQKLQTVNKSFNYWPFHTVEYKLLPISQKVNTTEDLNIKRYCPNCGTKQKPEYKFCPACGSKA